VCPQTASTYIPATRWKVPLKKLCHSFAFIYKLEISRWTRRSPKSVSKIPVLSDFIDWRAVFAIMTISRDNGLRFQETEIPSGTSLYTNSWIARSCCRIHERHQGRIYAETNRARISMEYFCLKTLTRNTVVIIYNT